MFVSVEISYYPLVEKFEEPIHRFIQKINDENIGIETGSMSTVITGEYTIIMNLLTETMDELMQQYPSVFTLKISNSCRVL
ncbi:MAG: thiamine-binding protein [Prolixibacteraceae bacterium]